METRLTFTTEAFQANMRLDLFIADKIAEKLPHLTRSSIKALIKDGLATVNDKSVKASYKVKEGDRVDLTVPAAEPSTLAAEAVPLDILFEDDDMIILNKPPGLTVHPGAGRDAGTLVNALLHHTADLSNVGGALRPGIVHRLDKDTSGVLAVAKNNNAHKALSEQFREHTTTRRYHALVWGNVKHDEATVDMSIGRDSSDRTKISPRARYKRKAVTHYEVARRYGFFTLLHVTIETGRTHQIRVHLSEKKHPVVGDSVYGKRTAPSVLDKDVSDMVKSLTHQCLHAITLGVAHPTTGKYMEFSAPYPEQMDALVKRLEEGAAPPPSHKEGPCS